MSFSWSNFNSKVTDDDPDIRHMALYDLHTELQKDGFSMDEPSQKLVEEAVRKLLDDKSSDVQGIAVRCLPPLVRKLQEVYVERLVTSLCNSCLKGDNKEKRDIAGIALRAVVAEIPNDFSSCVKKLTSPLVAGLGKTPDKSEALDVTNDVVKRFGALVSESHKPLQEVLLKELAAASVPTRKKAILCLASLCEFSSDALFHEVVSAIIDGIAQKQGDTLRKYIQMCSAVSRTAGQRLGKFLDQIVPKLVEHVMEGEFDEEDGDEVRENCIQAFHSFIERCPQQAGQFFDSIMRVCVTYLQHDPNYTYGEEDEPEEEMEEDGIDEEEEEMDQDDEDDDVSWKVRKASAKCLSAIIRTRQDQLEALYANLCSGKSPLVSDVTFPLLPDRFKEREESVKLDVFDVFTGLLQATQVRRATTREEDSFLMTTSSFRLHVHVKPEVKYLEEVQDKVVEKLLKCLKDNSVKVKIGAFQILKEMTIILRDKMKNHVGAFANAVLAALKDSHSTSSLKTEVLLFLRLLISTNTASFTDHLDALAPAVYQCVNDKYYKIIVEALRVCADMVRVIKRLPKDQSAQKTKELYGCVQGRLATQDIDQDVKENAIIAIGKILQASPGSLGAADLTKAQELLLHFLNNEMTRLTTIKTLTVIKEVDMDPKLCNEYVQILASFLRKNSRPLRQSALVTMRELIYNQKEKVLPAVHTKILDEINLVLSDQDLHLSYLGLSVCTAVLTICPSMVKTFEQKVLDKVVELLQSPLLQGNALRACVSLFEKLSESSTIGFGGLLTKVLSATQKAISKQVYQNVAEIVATLVSGASDADRQKTVAQFTAQLKAQAEKDVILALYCLGEIGLSSRDWDSDLVSANPKLISDTRRHFDSTTEEIKAAASIAVGHIVAGNLKNNLPPCLEDIKKDEAHRYLLLRSLKEAICVSGGPTSPLIVFIKDILPLLFHYAGCEEEGVRNVVAECIGKLALMQPNEVVLQLKEQNEAAAGEGAVEQFKRTSVVTALKYTIVEQPQPIDKVLGEHLMYFLVSALNKKGSVKLRRAGILLFTAAAHNKPDLVRANLATYMPALYAETPLDKSLVREINLGPFKHKMDDGLELRKAAFECMDILLDDTTPGSLLEFLSDYATFIAHVLFGIKDENTDIRMLSHLMLTKLSRIANALLPLLGALDQISETLTATVTKKLKTNAVQQDKDRHEDLIRSCLRAIDSLTKIPGALDNASFNKLVNQTIQNDADVKALLEQVLKEAETMDAHQL
eukprot:TRINITY_DN5030_c0_g1_i1.p1 TRINITY_DN5030_c0_g1~~TRINITY_DN5030_c0_g1_i1.p1  ORF type:complete len:1256 (+),score=241.90 TRINITY_DN5030_c0_g1_i1:44-3811(+)